MLPLEAEPSVCSARRADYPLTWMQVSGPADART
jgi:hypothetical protein